MYPPTVVQNVKNKNRETQQGLSGEIKALSGCGVGFERFNLSPLPLHSGNQPALGSSSLLPHLPLHYRISLCKCKTKYFNSSTGFFWSCVLSQQLLLGDSLFGRERLLGSSTSDTALFPNHFYESQKYFFLLMQGAVI